jgi:cation:H+ antiporter
MIYIAYLITAVIVVWCSILASRYIDLMDKTTKLSGAFLGGVLLSAVTSLPEMFTSISATTLIDSPGLCMGNILGSNLFNMAMLATISLIFLRSFTQSTLAKSHFYVMAFAFLMYATVFINYTGWCDHNFVIGPEAHPVLFVSITSLFIVVLYAGSVKFLAHENGTPETSSEVEAQPECPYTVRSLAIRFTVASLVIVAASIALTYITDIIADADHLNLGSGLAGAIFLGVATSLPEVTSSISLFRMHNFNIGVGNIVGSNVFNFFVIAIADMLYLGKGVYDFADSKVVNLAVFGILASILFYLMCAAKTQWMKALLCLTVIACYVAFLLV